MQPGRFDTDTEALKQRIQCHEQFGARDINEWIYSHLELTKGLALLDLGCGTGKQTLPLAEIVGDTGRVWAVDISQEALDTLAQSARPRGLERRIRVLRAGLDDLSPHLPARDFDRALACYSLYYARSPQTVFSAVHRALKPQGIFFFCGPAKDNNAELKQFQYRLRSEQPPAEGGGAEFMEQTGPPLARALFSSVESFTFENPLRFNSAQALYSYWSSYNLYDDKLEGAFKSAADEYFQHQPVFVTTKRVVGVRAVK